MEQEGFSFIVIILHTKLQNGLLTMMKVERKKTLSQCAARQLMLYFKLIEASFVSVSSSTKRYLLGVLG